MPEIPPETTAASPSSAKSIAQAGPHFPRRPIPHGESPSPADHVGANTSANENINTEIGAEDEERFAALESPNPEHGPSCPAWVARSDLRTTTDKVSAGLRGLKYAIRGDSGFFALAYRGLLIALTAALLGVGPMEWCFLVLGAALVLMAELTQSALNALTRALGHDDDPGLMVSRDITAAIGLVASGTAGLIAVTVLVIKFGSLQNWW